MRTKFFAGVAFAALIIPGAAYAQSTGSTDFDNGGEEVVVTARTTKGIGGVQLPDVPKSRSTITSELISRQRPGQTVNDIINLVPGVSFQNNDATGAAGGTFTIRGFDSTRISQTLDGIPLNDTGNYAIFSNQQQDPETLESVTVNLGTTDVDSPTASAVGGTVNIRTRVPSQNFGVMMSGTYGQYAGEGDPRNRDILRIFGMVDTGDIAHTGVRGFFSGSKIEAFNPFNNYGKLRKQQYNARLYKPLGDKGDFISIAGQWNENRNNFLGSVPLRSDQTQAVTIGGVTTIIPRIPGPNTANRAPLTAAERFYSINYPCLVNGVARPGVADGIAAAPAQPSAGASCGAEFDRRYNPSNTGNIRLGSRFTLSDKLVFTLDASYQTVKANGGGTVNLLEGTANLSQTTAVETLTGVINSGPNTGNAAPAGFGYYVGRDLNGDGDRLDTVLGISPSQTATRRYGAVAGLAYELDENNRIRLTYSLDYGRHRQTGEVGLLQANGEPMDVFPVNGGLTDASGAVLQKRDRLSYAILNQVSAQYRGKFFDNALNVEIGVRAPFFRRELNQNCFTVSANGNVSCVTPSGTAAYAAANPYTYFAPGVTTVGSVTRPTTTGTSCAVTTSACVVGFAPPQQRVLNYNRVLPSGGLTYNFTSEASIYASYAKGLSVPSTDNLYNSFYYAVGSPQATPKPETTDSYDVGLRYNTSKVQASIAGWFTKFQNRTVSVYDIESDTSIFRNLGTVNKYGADASLAYRPVRELLLYVFGSYLHSEIKTNVEAGRIPTTNATTFFQTAGKAEGGSPKWMFGGRAQGTIGLFDLGVQGKYTGARFVNDENLPVYTCLVSTTATGGICPDASQNKIYGARISSYVLVDLDLRFNIGKLLNSDKTFLQVNVSNLFDKVYIGGLSGSSGFVGLPNRYSIGNAVIGTPRSITATLQVGF
ncbi:TonB-dependent receptor [Sphingomonas sp. GB1N7]|uniref:TonB-dependent receptor n=1 Tax=Parasphingomonas caseinilytica TaxID=3096158 RepID=UPI002FC8A815